MRLLVSLRPNTEQNSEIRSQKSDAVRVSFTHCRGCAEKWMLSVVGAGDSLIKGDVRGSEKGFPESGGFPCPPLRILAKIQFLSQPKVPTNTQFQRNMSAQLLTSEPCTPPAPCLSKRLLINEMKPRHALLFLFAPRPRAVRSGVSAGQAKQGVLPSPFSARRACFLFASAPCARLFHFCAALCAAPWESAFLVCKL